MREERYLVQIMQSGKIFQKREEDFCCEQCGFFVVGNGYTNHCPSCLYSKHVDVFPGDRLEPCGGLMKPTALEKGTALGKLTHVCVKCGFVRKNRVHEADSFETLLAVARKSAEQR